MKNGLKEKLENYLQDIGGVVPYNEVRRMVEEVWESPKGGHYRMETLTRRGRKDNKLEVSNERIGKTYNEQGVITGFFYKPSQTQETAPKNLIETKEAANKAGKTLYAYMSENNLLPDTSRPSYKLISEIHKPKDFCCLSFWKEKNHDPKCYKLKQVEQVEKIKGQATLL